MTDCPINATVRPLLYRRRGEDKQALNVLTPDQFADLHNLKTARSQPDGNPQGGPTHAAGLP